MSAFGPAGKSVSSTSTSVVPPPSSNDHERRTLQDAHNGLKYWWQKNVKQLAARLHQEYIVEILLRQKPLPPSKNGRYIPLLPVQAAPLVDERRSASYVCNAIRSSRYTPWDFLPKQILFQGTRVHNMFFIAVGVPQTIPGLSTTGSFTTILPLLFFMLLTIVKEGYDDWRRHRMDVKENNRVATVVRPRASPKECSDATIVTYCKGLHLKMPRWMPLIGADNEMACISQHAETDVDNEYRWAIAKWKDIAVGDIVRLERDEAVPADIVLLYASGHYATAYVETMALDGETNLKSKQAPKLFEGCGTIAGIKACERTTVVSEDPNRQLYDYDGRAFCDDQPSLPLTVNEVVLRGSVLRNTTYAIGMVLNTGEECKVRTASHDAKAKKPRLEHQSDYIVLFLIALVVLLSIGVSMGYLLWHDPGETSSWYLQNSYPEFKEIIIGFLIMFNNIIPLAMYVSLEIIKIGQMIMIHSDQQMYDEQSNTPMSCNTNTILENLGQVSYLLSDKTGTLTENVMKFKKASIAGRVWHAPDPANDSVPFVPPSHASEEKNTGQRRLPDNSALTFADIRLHIEQQPDSSLAKNARDYLLALALCNTALPEPTNTALSYQASSPDELALVQAARDLGYKLATRTPQCIILIQNEGTDQRRSFTYDILDVIEFSSKRKRMSILLRCPDQRIWLLCKGADSVIVPRLRQSGLASRKSKEIRRSIQLERDQRKSLSIGTRPSTVARPSLTLSRRSSTMDIKVRPEGNMLDIPRPNHDMRRERLSGQLSPLENLALPLDDSMMFTQCFKHLDEFATEGLRTLMFAHKYLTPSEYAGWKKIFVEATTSLSNRQHHIEVAGELIEQGLDLLGASAIEDKLQMGVPETIEKLRRANIKIWMLTGDKRETAITIAHAAHICKPDSDVFVLDVTKGDLEAQLRDVTMEVASGYVHSVVVVDGGTLSVIEGDPSLNEAFYTLISGADSVICCRASPAQKAGIVNAIRSRLPKALTLTVGDGANDVAMIQASHVGVGISGQEGLQAARVADFSIAQFRFLQRLILVHGRWSYIRTAKFILMTFWKEMFFYMMQALYLRYNGYTGTSLYEQYSLTVLNTLFTSLCVIVPAIFEQDLKAQTLLAVPELYLHGQCNSGLNMPDFLLRMVLGVAQAIMVWFIVWTSYGNYNLTGDNGLFAIGNLCFSLGIIWTNVSLLVIETHCKTIIVGVSFFVTVGGWWAWNAFLSAIYTDNLSPYAVNGGFTKTYGNDWSWWLTFVIALAALTTLEAVHKAVRRHLVAVGLWPPWKRKLGYNARDLDLGIWQEMEADPVIAERLEELAGEAAFTGRPHEDVDAA